MTDLRACIVCHRDRLTEHEAQTCVACLGKARRALIDIERLYALLPAEIEGRAGTAKPLDVTGVRGDGDPMPGGDALVLLAGGSSNTIAARPTRTQIIEALAEGEEPVGDRTHAADNLPTDTPSVVATLASWEDDFRSVLGLPAASDEATVTGCTVFLLRGLSYMAQHHPAFDEFARDMRELRGHLERTLREGEPVERAAIECPGCEGELRREYLKPDSCPKVWVPPQPELGYDVALKYQPLRAVPGYWKPCDHEDHGHDQGGMRDHWKCRDRRCARIVEAAEYWLLVRQRKQEQQEAS